MSHDFLDSRLTERRNPRTRDIDEASALELVALINAEDAGVPAAVAQATTEIAQVIDLVEGAFRAGRRLYYVGAGTSGRLGVLDAAECPPTFGTPPELVQGLIAGGAKALVRAVEGAEDDVNAGADAITTHGVEAGDVVIGIAASGTTPFVRGALGRAQTLGAGTALVTCTDPPAVLKETCDVCVVVRVGPEVVTGSTRMKAGTATKLVLNTITTGAMVRWGKTYGNLMVDLRATNAKLLDRSRRIVMEVCSVSSEEAEQVLERAGGVVKTAIAMQRLGIEREEAERLLAEHNGRLREVIGAPPPVVGA